MGTSVLFGVFFLFLRGRGIGAPWSGPTGTVAVVGFSVVCMDIEFRESSLMISSVFVHVLF